MTEQQLRIDLAACYRLVAHYGWDDLIFTHISARIPGKDNEFLINPYGMMFSEITASSLVKVGLDGQMLDDSEYPINPAGFIIHSSVHEVREDAHCVMHLHTPVGIAVSAQKQGLLPLSQQAAFALCSLSYHAYEGVSINPEEKKRLQNDLSQSNNLILRNHGLLTCGDSIPQTFLNMYNLQKACEIQVMAQSSGSELITVQDSIIADISEMAAKVTKGMGGHLAWPGLLRLLDRVSPGYKD